MTMCDSVAMKAAAAAGLALAAITATGLEAAGAPRRVLLETYTGAWCQFCPDGQIIAQGIAAAHPGEVVVVAIHQGDAMDVGSELPGIYASGYPTACVNRQVLELSRGHWQEEVTERLGQEAPADLLLSHTHDPATGLVRATVRVRFRASSTGAMRVHLMVKESPLEGTGSGWDQTNAFNTTPGHPFYGAGDPIVGFPHADVLRALPEGQLSGGLVAPDGVVAGDGAEEEFEFYAQAGWDPSKVTLVAFVTEDVFERITPVWQVVEVPLGSIPSAVLTDDSGDADDGLLQLGPVRPGGAVSATAMVTNEGAGPLELGALSTPPSPFFVDSDGCSGVVLGAGESCLLTVRGSPQAPGLHQGDLRLPTSDAVFPELLLSLAVTANQAPTAGADVFFITPGEPLVVPAPGVLGNDTDPEGDPLTATLIATPTGGTLVLDPAGGLVFEAAEGFEGLATFSYAAADTVGAGEPVIAYLVVAEELEPCEPGEGGCGAGPGRPGRGAAAPLGLGLLLSGALALSGRVVGRGRRRRTRPTG